MKGGLGKGIDALIPKTLIKPDRTEQQTLVDASIDTTNGVYLIDIERIQPNPFQPRREFDETALNELASSITAHGVITPITVRKLFDGFELVSGERRLRASKIAGLTQIPAYVMTVASDAQMLELAIIENVQRQDLNPLEIAHGYQRLIEECHLRHEDVALRVGKDRSTVANMLRLLKLPSEAQVALKSRQITMGHARALLALSSHSAQQAVLGEIRARDLSVRKTEALVKDIELGRKEVLSSGEIRNIDDKREVIKPTQALSSDLTVTLSEIEHSLRHLFATQVRVRMKNESSGAIEVEFYSFDDLERLLELLATLERTPSAQ